VPRAVVTPRALVGLATPVIGTPRPLVGFTPRPLVGLATPVIGTSRAPLVRLARAPTVPGAIMVARAVSLAAARVVGSAHWSILLDGRGTGATGAPTSGVRPGTNLRRTSKGGPSA
jgi:hypothetical protein